MFYCKSIFFLHNENTHGKFPIQYPSRVLWLLRRFFFFKCISWIRTGSPCNDSRPSTNLLEKSFPFASLDAVFFGGVRFKIVFSILERVQQCWSFETSFPCKLGTSWAFEKSHGSLGKIGGILRWKLRWEIRDDGFPTYLLFCGVKRPKRRPWAQWKPEYHHRI